MTNKLKTASYMNHTNSGGVDGEKKLRLSLLEVVKNILKNLGGIYE